MSRFVLRTGATPEASRKLAKAAVCILADTILSWETIHELDLIMTEGCANVVRHGYRNGTLKGDVEMVLEIEDEKHVDISITDWGVGLEQDKTTPCDPGPLAEGGRGLFIMSELSDVFEVKSDENSTTLFVRKLIPADQWKK
ncbi:MAG: ATP-binding protein [Desulfovibrio sp.]|uniref:ATP-binding protein n=1 Tax=Desulfovibrio sp. 7SRBS1 TaxID=3378064 RepID=UPI003B40E30E